MKKNLRISDLPPQERPYEKCERCGAESLSDCELLAVMIRTGLKDMNSLDIAMNLLSVYCPGGSLSGLARMDLKELEAAPGIGRVKAIQLQCLCEFSRRLWRSERSEQMYFCGHEETAAFYMEKLRRLDHEECWILMMDSKCGFIGEFMLSSGTVKSSPISPREVFIKALKYGAVMITLVHNHPSGDPTPSRKDIEVTKRLIEAGRLMDVSLADSIIIGDGVYVSFRHNGILTW